MAQIHEIYVSPQSKEKLFPTTNGLIDANGNEFTYKDGIIDFIYPKILPQSDTDSIAWYKDNAAVYDQFLPLTFETFDVDEDIERTKMIDLLRVEKHHKVLETGCGTGRDSEKIASQLGESGELFLQDISYEILKIAVDKFSQLNFAPNIEFSLANGYFLPFEDNYFDSAFHFGGLNTFGDIKQAFNEMVRVVKPGGRIVVGDESMPQWLRDTEFGKVLMNSNPHYKFDLPLDYLPVEARNVRIDWIIGGVFYVISFDVGEGIPYANLDFEIPGVRGGTHRTRYYGHTEGLSPEAIELAKKAREISGKSMFDWLNDAVIEAARKEGK